ncbi:MAG: hypothetical protein MJ202_09830 [Lentisphaeria bacterium]|nr:hypothetical protein [Lentisphaeria bacterium]
MKTMKKVALVLVLLSAMNLLFSQEKDPLAIGIADLKTHFLGDSIDGWNASPNMTKRLLETQREDGTWPEVDYENSNTSNWLTAQHVELLLHLAKAWHLQHDAAVEKAFHKGLKFWLDAKLVNRNWWWNEIGVPRSLGLATLLTEECLSEEERLAVCKAMEVTKIQYTGQNRVAVSIIVMTRGMLARDVDTVKTAVETIAEEVKMSSLEGIREDWSFHQHGNQPQMGNYGLAYIEQMTSFTTILQGTPFALPAEKTALLHHLLKDGYTWILWKGYMDVSSMGRQLGHGEQKRKADTVLESFKRFRKAGFTIPEEGPWGFKYFFASAYAVYRDRKNDWMGSVRMATPKIVGVETWVNGDSPNGGHMADGALFVYSTGREYEDVFPLWDNWRLIPGITTYLNLPPARRSWKDINVGANEADEITAREAKDGTAEVDFLLQRDGLTARKSWKFTSEGVEATGKEITATDETSEVITCVEHSLAQENAKILPYENGCLKAVNGDFEYIIEAPGENIVAKIEDRAGSLQTVMRGAPDTIIKGRVFCLYIRHGVKPRNASYHYFVRKKTTH